MQVVDIHFVFNNLTVFVGRTEDTATFRASARHPNGEAKRIVVSTVTALREWGAPELAGKHNQRFLQQAATFEIGQSATRQSACRV